MSMIRKIGNMYQPYSKISQISIAMNTGGLPSVPLSEATNNPRPAPLGVIGNAKKKRRANAKTSRSLPCPITQDLHEENLIGFPRPPQSSVYGDTVVANNPFDDSPMQRTPSGIMMSQSMHLYSSHNQQQPMGGHQIRGMNPMADFRPMMQHNMGIHGGNPINPMGMSSQSSIMGILNNPMNRMSPVHNIAANQQHPPINMMNNSMGYDGPIGPNIGSHPHMPMNNRSSPMNNMSSSHHQPMNMMNPMNNPGSQGINPMMMGHTCSQINGRHVCSRSHGTGNIIGNHSHMENPMIMGHMSISDSPHGGPQSINDFRTNVNQTYSNNMGMQINAGDIVRTTNMGHNMNITTMNVMANDTDVVEEQIGNIDAEIPPIRHPINMGAGNLRNQGIQERNAMGTRHVALSNEKIYPADQQIIFNTQNRNAPPIYVCGSCHKEVRDNDQGIVCESGCNFWFHRSCVGLTVAAFQMLTQAPYAEWACDKCSREKKIPPVKFTNT